MAFSPAAVSTTLGGAVTWTFQDSVAHTSTSDQGFWDSGIKSGGATYARTFTSAGTFAYHCTIHSMMRGTVKVPLTASGTASKGYKLALGHREGHQGDHLRRADPAGQGQVGVAEGGHHRHARRSSTRPRPASTRCARAPRRVGHGRAGRRPLQSPFREPSSSRPPLRHPHPPDRGDARRDGAGRGRRRRLRRGPDGARARGAGRRAVRPRGRAVHARPGRWPTCSRSARWSRPGRRCSASRRRTSPGPSSARTARSAGSRCAPGRTRGAAPTCPRSGRCSRPTWARSSCRTAAISVENTHNFAGGAVLPLERAAGAARLGERRRCRRAPRRRPDLERARRHRRPARRVRRHRVGARRSACPRGWARRSAR